MSTDQEKISIDIEVIETPRGKVVSLESIKNIINALNLLNVELISSNDKINNEVLNEMINIERELKAIRKLLAENIITHEALKENIREMNDTLNSNLTSITKNFEKLTKVLEKFESNIEKKIISSLTKFIQSSKS
ncbi:MAG: hypothetical protein HWN67_15860 [Candidatus Helarchaeota archaeon]|nr:hypothetical protein [Candidatus Helarchaeota archaeon]